MPADGTIVVRSPDTDVFILLLAYSSYIRTRVLFDTGNGTARRLLAVNEFAAKLGEDIVNALSGFHAFTGCDTTSAFVHRGKRRPFAIIKSSCEFTALFQQFGKNAEPLSINSLQQLEHFVCCMYSH